MEKDKDYISKFDKYLMNGGRTEGSGAAALFARERSKDHGGGNELKEQIDSN